MNAIGWLWLSFLGLWKVAGVGHETPDGDDIKLSLLLYLGITLLIFADNKRVPNAWLYAIVACFIAAAFARYELGESFYGKVSTVNTGLYAVFNHPIYAAVGAAAILTAFAYNNAQAYTGAGAVLAALYAKAKDEETNG